MYKQWLQLNLGTNNNSCLLACGVVTQKRKFNMWNKHLKI